MKRRILLYCLIAILFISCRDKTILISIPEKADGTIQFSANEIKSFLDKVYTDYNFIIAEEGERKSSFYIELKNDVEKLESLMHEPGSQGSFCIQSKGNSISIIGFDSEGIRNGSYAFLEKLGFGFGLSENFIPSLRDKWEIPEYVFFDKAIVKDRIILNWHNFLSGCTSWNEKEWKEWLLQAVRLRFNTIMIHLYGNNPLYTFSFNGEKKNVGYLSTTNSGRDWGLEHVTDVRNVFGGDLFDSTVFGSEAAFVPDSLRSESLASMMQGVFHFADSIGLNLWIALDIDTKESNPQNVINTLSRKHLLQSMDEFILVNPESDSGYLYYLEILKSVLYRFPETDNLILWTRRYHSPPSVFLTPWRGIKIDDLPEKWKNEYTMIKKRNPDLSFDPYLIGNLAIGKISEAFIRGKKELKPELRISLGCWDTDYLKSGIECCSPDVEFVPLDFSIKFDNVHFRNELNRFGTVRKIHPILWAQHDDHRYMGRPYYPFENFSDKISNCNSQGYGIIHWNTRPLDLYFMNISQQCWESMRNRSVESTIEDYVKKGFGCSEEILIGYFSDWIKNAPMFGRETTDHFMDPGRFIIGEMPKDPQFFIDQAKYRLNVINSLDTVLFSREAKNRVNYFRRLDSFFIAFIQNQWALINTEKFINNKDYNCAFNEIETFQPEKCILEYAKAINTGYSTRGELGLLYSLNTRWLPDFYKFRQLLKMDTIHYVIRTTRHDSFAMAPGIYSYSFDINKKIAVVLGIKEIFGNSRIPKGRERIVSDSGLYINYRFEIPLECFYNEKLPSGKYHLILRGKNYTDNLVHFEIHSGSIPIQFFEHEMKKKEIILPFQSDGSEVVLVIDPLNCNFLLNSISVAPIN